MLGFLLSFGCSSAQQASSEQSPNPLDETRSPSVPKPPGADWTCLGTAEPAPPPPASVPVRLVVEDYASGQALSSLLIRNCKRDDFLCTEHYSYREDLTTAYGIDDVISPGDFDLANLAGGAFALIQPFATGVIAPDTDPTTSIFGLADTLPDASVDADSYIPIFYHFDGPLVAPRTVAEPVLAHRVSTYYEVAETMGVSFDPTLGHITLRAYDCAGQPASGVRFELSNPLLDAAQAQSLGGDGNSDFPGSQVVAFRHQDGAPQRLPNSPGEWTTDARGELSFANIPQGNVVAHSFVQSTGLRVGSQNGLFFTSVGRRYMIAEVSAQPYRRSAE